MAFILPLQAFRDELQVTLLRTLKLYANRPAFPVSSFPLRQFFNNFINISIPVPKYSELVMGSFREICRGQLEYSHMVGKLG
jgi:hypothetical protein